MRLWYHHFPFLVLFDSTPTVLTSSTTGRLSFTLPASGTYTISVSAFTVFTTGPYTLQLSCSGNATKSYSAEVPVLARVQGSAFFRSSIDFNNNTTKNGVTALYQFSYTCVAAACNPVGQFYRTSPQTIVLNGRGNFHSDDFIQYLDSLGLLQPSAVQGSIGTLLVTFGNLDTSVGFEGTVTARTFNRIVEADSSQGTVGFAYNASLFFESAHVGMVGTARDTKSAPTIAGKLRSNLGVRNTDLKGTGQSVSLVLNFYDTATGLSVGNQISISGIQPGELRQVSDVWASAGIPDTVHSVIVSATNPNGGPSTATFEGYVTIIDGQNTQDAAFFEMKCSDLTGCGS